MGKVVQFPVEAPLKRGPKKARNRRKPSLEDLGQLTIFDQLSDSIPVVSLPARLSFFEKALILDEEEDPEAERYYLLAVENNESVEDAFCNLGILKSAAGEQVEAIDYLTKCLKENPRHFEAHYNLGNIYADLGNLSLARIHYEFSVSIDPVDPNGHYNLALVHISMREYQDAIERINRFIELAPPAEHEIAYELIKTLNAIAQ